MSKIMKKKIIIFSPVTYNLKEKVIKAVKASDLEFIWFNERLSENIIFKIISRYLNKVARKFAKNFYIRQLSKLKEEKDNIKYFLVIKGESIHPDVIKYSRLLFEKAQFIIYYWDSVKLIPNSELLPPLFDKCCTFDSYEAKRFSWKYIPIFSANSLKFDGNISGFKKKNKFSFAFIGVTHSDRFKVALQIKRNYLKTKKSREKFYFYFYAPTLYHLFTSFLKQPLSLLILRKHIHLKPLDPYKISEVYKQSNCILDIQYPGQKGVSMRSFEVLESGKKLITTNEYIKSSDLYDPSRVFIISRKQTSISESFLKEEFLTLSNDEKNKMTPEYWLSLILS